MDDDVGELVGDELVRDALSVGANVIDVKVVGDGGSKRRRSPLELIITKSSADHLTQISTIYKHFSRFFASHTAIYIS